MLLPTLDETLDHAVIERVEWRSSDDLELELTPLQWCGSRDFPRRSVTLVLRGVFADDGTRAWIAAHVARGAELAGVRYAFGHRSVAGDVRLQVAVIGAPAEQQLRCGDVFLQPD